MQKYRFYIQVNIRARMKTVCLKDKAVRFRAYLRFHCVRDTITFYLLYQPVFRFFLGFGRIFCMCCQHFIVCCWWVRFYFSFIVFKFYFISFRNFEISSHIQIEQCFDCTKRRTFFVRQIVRTHIFPTSLFYSPR